MGNWACADTEPLTDRGLANLEALARLVGYVRFFHPSDGVAQADWDQFVLDAVGPVEEAADPEALAAALADAVGPVAPTVRVAAGSAADLAGGPTPVGDGGLTVRWVHHGVHLRPGNPYRSTRVTDEPGRHRLVLSAPFHAEPLQGRRVRFHVEVATGDGTACIAVVVGDHRVEAGASVDGGLATVELDVPADGAVGQLEVVLEGSGPLWIVDPVLEAADDDGSRPVALRASELEAKPDDDIPFGWHADMTVPYRISVASRGDRRAIRAEPVALPQADEPLVVDLGGGVAAAIPLALRVDAPVDDPAPPGAARTAATVPGAPEHRATRLADVIVAWTVFQHFYPYFDVVGTDWAGMLPRALRAAAEAVDGRAHLRGLRTLVAALHDGHGGVYHSSLGPTGVLPLAWDVVEGALVVTSLHDGADVPIEPGWVVERIDGRPALEVLAEEEALVSGSPQWKRSLALRAIGSGDDPTAELTVVDGDGETRRVAVERVPLASLGGPAAGDPLPDVIDDLRDGILYVDLNRLDLDRADEAVERMRSASGIVFDLRGYPRDPAPRLLSLLASGPIESAQWRIAVSAWPDRRNVVFGRMAWFIPPERPRIDVPVAFVTGGGAISYAESCMGIVEAYGLGTIVGGPTAGANGNNNIFPIPGGFMVGWTGMRVVKHDGSTHHNVGILPDVPVTRTRAGVAARRDEALERAVDEVARRAGLESG